MSISEILSRWLKRKNLDAELRQYTIWDKWSTLVGSRIAAHTQPQNLRDGVLTITVSSAAWLNELNFIKAGLVRKINENVGIGTVIGIRLVAGTICRQHPCPPEPDLGNGDDESEFPPEYLAEVEREMAIIQDPELHRVMRRARLAQLKRQLRFSQP